jgi:hypothetical protein
MTSTYIQLPIDSVTTHPETSGVFKLIVNKYWVINTSKNKIFFDRDTEEGVCSGDYRYLEHRRSTDPDIPTDTHIDKIPVVYVDVTDEYNDWYGC